MIPPYVLKDGNVRRRRPKKTRNHVIAHEKAELISVLHMSIVGITDYGLLPSISSVRRFVS